MWPPQLRRVDGVRLPLLILALGVIALAGDNRAVTLRWADMGQMVEGKRISVKTTQGATLKGRSKNLTADSLVLEDGRQVRRAEVAEVRLTDYVGNGRRTGKLLGGTAGLLGGLIGAAAVGLKEDARHKDRNKVVAGALGLGGFPAGLLGGWLLGRRADREVTVIRIIPVTP